MTRKASLIDSVVAIFAVTATVALIAWGVSPAFAAPPAGRNAQWVGAAQQVVTANGRILGAVRQPGVSAGAAAALRVTVAPLGTTPAGIFYLVVENSAGGEIGTLAFNAGADLGVDQLHTFTVGVSPDLRYEFAYEEAGTLMLVVDEQREPGL